jgi:acid phosphatase
MLEEFSNLLVSAKKRGVFSSLLSGSKSASKQPALSETARILVISFPEEARDILRKHYVRIRYNNRPVRIPGCVVKAEKYLPSDDTGLHAGCLKGECR